MRYKHFLDMLTPAEWFEHHKKLREDHILEIRRKNYEVKLKDWERLKKKLTDQHRREIEAKKEAKNKQNAASN